MQTRRRKSAQPASDQQAQRPPTLLRQPARTVHLFAAAACDALSCWLRWLWRRRATAVYPLLVLLGTLLAAHHAHGPHRAALLEAELFASAAAWWLGLGVLSSIGLGTGLHSGMLFLFPHIAKVCRSAEACCSVAFDSRKNSWFALPAGELFACPAGKQRPCDAVPYSALLLKNLAPAILWGIGTALGEVPPYLLSRAAAEASKANQAHAGPSTGSASPNGLMERSKAWMQRVLQRNGFWGLVALAAWPNSLFDFVGVCCGHFGMSFRTFLGGTLLGKGFIKASWQCALFTLAFSTQSRTAFVERVAGLSTAMLPSSWKASELVQRAAAGLSGFGDAAAGGALGQQHAQGMLAAAWSACMTGIMLYFVASCVEQVAQHRFSAPAAKPRTE